MLNETVKKAFSLKRSSEINKSSKTSKSLSNLADQLCCGAAENAAKLKTFQIPLSSALLPFLSPETARHLSSSQERRQAHPPRSN